VVGEEREESEGYKGGGRGVRRGHVMGAEMMKGAYA